MNLEMKCVKLAEELAHSIPIDMIAVVCKLAEQIADVDYLNEHIRLTKTEIAELCNEDIESEEVKVYE